ncbi:MAG: HAD family hydrolase [Pseudanabaenaceae cyanobacterium bins.68]|nr:HAD family hydrolase [Pseudanabaenaceae cyanobacterium bins.68]
MSLRPAVFLDRDGVLNQEVGYIHRLEDLVLLPGVAQGIKALNQAQIFTCLVSNQAGAARGFYPLGHIDALHDRLVELLAIAADAKLDALYYCPSLSQPAGGKVPELSYWSTWRKPNTGMLVSAAWDHHLDLNQSYMIGDKATDIDLAVNSGCTGILVTSGYGEQVLAGSYQHRVQPHLVAKDLPAAIAWILQRL